MSETLYVVDKLFPVGSVNLIFGPPRSGRSTLLMQIMWEWAHARDVLGYKSYPNSYFCLIDVLRRRSAVQAHLSRLGYTPSEIPIATFLEHNTSETRTFEALFEKASKLAHNNKVIFVDGIHALCQGNITYQRDVVTLLSNIGKRCNQDGITIIATLATSKTAEASGGSVLQRVAGSLSWVEQADTLIHIAHTTPERISEPQRTIMLCSADGKPSELNYAFNDSGLLELVGDATLQPALDTWLAQITPGSEIKTEEIIEAAEARQLSRTAAERWMRQQKRLGSLTSPSRGIYVKPVAQ